MCIACEVCVPSILGWIHFSSRIKQHFHFLLFPILCHVTVTVNTGQFFYKKKKETIQAWNFSGRWKRICDRIHSCMRLESDHNTKCKHFQDVLSHTFSACFHLKENWPPGCSSNYNLTAHSCYDEAEPWHLEDGETLRAWLPCLSGKQIKWSSVLRSLGTLGIISPVHLPCMVCFGYLLHYRWEPLDLLSGV